MGDRNEREKSLTHIICCGLTKGNFFDEAIEAMNWLTDPHSADKCYAHIAWELSKNKRFSEAIETADKIVDEQMKTYAREVIAGHLERIQP